MSDENNTINKKVDTNININNNVENRSAKQAYYDEKRQKLISEFESRIKEILGSDDEFNKFLEASKNIAPLYIRTNTLLISPDELFNKLKNKFNISQPFPEFPEIFRCEDDPYDVKGNLGRTIEHQIGYFYVQDLASMLSVLALEPKPNEVIIDLCASPGSKTTQLAARMENTGTLFANEYKSQRLNVLHSNLARCKVTNVVTIKDNAVNLPKKFTNNGIKFDRILLDPPCSGEGMYRPYPKKFNERDFKSINTHHNLQKTMIHNALKALKVGGTLVYSTCTYAPEENEAVINDVIKTYGSKIDIMEPNLPVEGRSGITEFKGEKFSDLVKRTRRIFPQDCLCEGFYVAKLILKEELL